jgi:DNA-binding GntR family transcriptional regulator
LARRRGVELTVRDLVIERAELTPELAEALGADPGSVAASISRVLLANGEPAATMVDTIHPSIELPPEPSLRRAMERGDMVLDVLTAYGVPIAYANTRIVPRLLSARVRAGKALQLAGSIAVLELLETFHLTSGEVVHHSTDIFAPSVLDLHVIRWIEARRPAQVNFSGRDGGEASPRKRGRR